MGLVLGQLRVCVHFHYIAFSKSPHIYPFADCAISLRAVHFSRASAAHPLQVAFESICISFPHIVHIDALTICGLAVLEHFLVSLVLRHSAIWRTLGAHRLGSLRFRCTYGLLAIHSTFRCHLGRRGGSRFQRNRLSLSRASGRSSCTFSDRLLPFCCRLRTWPDWTDWPDWTYRSSSASGRRRLSVSLSLLLSCLLFVRKRRTRKYVARATM